ncbi:MAG: hypothetical protein EOM47_10515 [Bacteroidia bacterium]|nr:hypothetical protein [Bacteroidia bacterium]
MAEQIYFIFWALDETKYPYDENKDYCISTVKNNQLFIENVIFSNDNRVELNKFLVSDLLRIYINISYNKDFPEKYKTDAIKWIRYTENLLKENNMSTDFLQSKYIEDIINKFQPKNDFIYFYIQTEGKKLKNRYLRYDDIFNQMGFNYDLETTDEYFSKKNSKSHSLKIKTLAILILLKELNKGKGYNDYTNIAAFISFITGNSSKKIRNETGSQFQLKDYHDKEIAELNDLLKKININFTINKVDTY